MTRPEQQDSRPSNRDVLVRLFQMINTGDLDSVDDVFDPDLLTVEPQTCERVEGRDEYKEMAESFKTHGAPQISEEERQLLGDEGESYVLTPMFTTVKVHGTGDTLVATTKNRYPDGSDWYTIGIATLRGGKIVKQVLFFAPVFEPPAWRAQWVETIEGSEEEPTSQASVPGSLGAGAQKRALLTRLFDLIDAGDYDKFDEIFRPDVVTDYPQSGERVVGLENLTKIMRSYPGGGQSVNPNERILVGAGGRAAGTGQGPSAVRVEDAGNWLVSSVRTRYPDGSEWYTVGIHRFEGDRMAHQVLYFAPVMEAPEWRAKWVVSDLGDY